MEKTKSDAKALTIKMDLQTYKRLRNYTEEAGQTMTIAIERAINQYIDNYEEDKRILAEYKNRDQ